MRRVVQFVPSTAVMGIVRLSPAMQRAARMLRAPPLASPTDLPEPHGERADRLQAQARCVAVVGMRPLARERSAWHCATSRVIACHGWPTEASLYQQYEARRTVVAPRVGALALVLQNTEDGGFLYARYEGEVCDGWRRRYRRRQSGGSRL